MLLEGEGHCGEAAGLCEQAWIRARHIRREGERLVGAELRQPGVYKLRVL